MATKKPKGLGRGLDVLLGPSVELTDTDAAALRELRLDDLVPGRYQPRSQMDEGALYELAQSIKTQGVMQPVLVRSLPDGRFEIIAGERRTRAARLAGLDTVPALVKEADDRSTLSMALIENLQREDLNPLEEARGIARLIDEFGHTHEQAGQAVGRSRTATSNLLRLLQLADAVQTMLLAGDLDMGHARALLSLDKAQQVQAAQQILAKRLSVREAEKLVARTHQGEQAARPVKAAAAAKDRDWKRLEEELSEHFTAPVEIRAKAVRKGHQSGEVAIRFSTLDELDGLLALLRGHPADA
ncbi:ParB/RepB/Spo0J family partition protein [Thiomonas intermedia]|uniref:ParB/RepB/Spo0J family partition protein n=1 Tax=Thiomonas intermedia TaxID=926 RepID=UPI0009A4EF44|nr:ParB/RepB/Spo0J family partition protein [Thiomonas intermedia]